MLLNQAKMAMLHWGFGEPEYSTAFSAPLFRYAQHGFKIIWLTKVGYVTNPASSEMLVNLRMPRRMRSEKPTHEEWYTLLLLRLPKYKHFHWRVRRSRGVLVRR